jgi:chaperone modulatory protein CbpM
MQIANHIAIDEFCNSWNIETSFINSLQETGLIEVVIINETKYIDVSQLQLLEKCIRFYYELDINLEGIETIMHLLLRMNSMQNDINNLRNKLRLFERSAT